MATREVLTRHKELKAYSSDDGCQPLKKVPGEFWNPYPWRQAKVDCQATARLPQFEQKVGLVTAKVLPI